MRFSRPTTASSAILLGLSLLQPVATFPDIRTDDSPAATKHFVKLFEDRYMRANSLQAVFLESYLENDSLIRSESGAVYFRKPGKMRWEYESPEKTIFLVDGKWAWFYVPADHTAFRVVAKQSSDWRASIALLTQSFRLQRVCSHLRTSVTKQPETPGNTLLFCLMRGSKLTEGPRDIRGQIESSAQAQASSSSQNRALSFESRAIAQGEAVFLELQPETGILYRVLISQPGGVSMEFKFTHWQFDPPVQDSLFRFTVPSGVVIVNGDSSSLPTS